jgi:hypothetical protein
MRIFRNIADRKGLEENEKLAFEALQVKTEVAYGDIEPKPTASGVTEEKVQTQEEADPKKERQAAKKKV